MSSASPAPSESSASSAASASSAQPAARTAVQPDGTGGDARTQVRLRHELTADPARLTCALLLAVAATGGTLALPLLVRRIITDFSAHRALGTDVALMCVVAVCGALAQAVAGMLLARIGERMTYRLRTRIMEHALRLPLPVVRAQGTGELTARITSDALLLREVVDVATQLPLAGLTVVATLFVMVWIDWVLTLVTVLALAVLSVLVLLILRRMKVNVGAQQDAVGRVAQRFTASLEALATVKAYRAEPVAAAALAGDADRLRAIALQGGRLSTLVPAVLTLGNQFAMISVILTGGARLASGDLEVAAFAAFLLYLLQTVPSVSTLATGFGRLQGGLAARDRCNDLLALPLEAGPHDADRPVPVPVPGAPAVEFRSVSCTHSGSDHPALRDVSFTTAPTGLTAVVGPSGAGKSTALALIDRFVQPDAGSIRVLGHDSRVWPLEALRARIAYVDQAFTLLEATARENLQLGRTRPASDDELAAALAAVGLTEDVARLPYGLDTVLGRASDLSGGQRQRMALARALLSDAGIVLLDEPTSQLDGLNEQRFRAVVDTLALTRAVIVVAHRLSTVQHARHVVMMSQGTVVDAGEHDTLLSRCLPYRELVASQALPVR
ncbi:ABC transporter ATP-binding protein [Actinacidiphila acidipaludis]|uniref:ABC transporter ATP-binding protein/permease n=1 Tax=Actinacidiphila acidipaludis TaxID=2873382 RepID=A0ABS7Q918_9ACTN|nr:ABC transporter ATP-binding protein [Streptomyces acidipaludis]MBY8879640.1 ABC transporter ATP-binding protein/permease [Streptomyces acidipaludis]